MTDREEIRQMMIQEQAEGAMRDCIEIYRKQMMDAAMQIRGAYEAYLNVGFNSYEALTLVMKSIK